MNATLSTSRAARRRWRWVLVSTGLGSWLVTASLSTINVAFPELQEHFSSYSLRSLSWVVTSYTIAFGALLIPSGRIADRYGRRLVFNYGLALFGAGAVMSAVSPTLGLVIAGRVLQGVGGAVIVPASLGLLLEVSEDRDRLRSVTLWSVSNTVGGASGPTLGALVVNAGGWRGTFFFGAVAAVITWLIGRKHLPRSGPAAGDARIDVLGVVLTAVAMAAVTLAVSEGNRWGWTSGAVVGLFASAAVASVGLVRRSQAHPQPILPLDLFRHRMFSVSIVALTVFGIAGGGMQLLNVLFLRNIWDYSALQAGIAVTPAPAFATLCAPFSGRLGERYGPRAVAVPGAVVLVIGIGWYLLAINSTPNYWIAFFPGSAITGIGVSMIFPMLSAAAVHDADVPRLSLASGTARTANQLGTAIGISLLFAALGDAPIALSHFRDGWRLLVIMTAVAGVIANRAVAASTRARTADSSMRLSRHPSERSRAIVASAVGVVVAVATAFAAPWQLAVLTGWNASAITLLGWIWFSIASLTADETRAVATREDNSRAASLLLLVVASSISLVVVILAFVEAERSHGAQQVLLNVSGVAGVLLSWTVVHTVFMLRYAHLFYTNPDGPGGIDFPRHSPRTAEPLPDYRDFAYVAFTIGMTFQVSDTDINSKSMRRVILLHAMLSWLFGAIIVATTINLIANLLR